MSFRAGGGTDEYNAGPRVPTDRSSSGQRRPDSVVHRRSMMFNIGRSTLLELDKIGF
ncbi:MAG: hypothetical protein ABR923_17230 [Terracidiphilus sp.]